MSEVRTVHVLYNEPAGQYVIYNFLGKSVRLYEHEAREVVATLQVMFDMVDMDRRNRNAESVEKPAPPPEGVTSF